MWEDQFEAYSQECKVLRYDLRGFGKSACPSPDGDYRHTEDLKALLDFLGIPKAYVMGLSMGIGLGHLGVA